MRVEQIPIGNYVKYLLGQTVQGQVETGCWDGFRFYFQKTVSAVLELSRECVSQFFSLVSIPSWECRCNHKGCMYIYNI